MPEIFKSSAGYGLAMRWQAFLVGLIPSALKLSDVVCTVSEFCVTLNESFIVQGIEAVTFTLALVLFGVGWGKAKIRKESSLGKYSK